jgi:hypothetical protein
MTRASTETEELSLHDAAQALLDECRMVLPGLQALLGFQLTVVFSTGFSEKLAAFDQRLHLVSLALVAVAIGLVMTPAAYHRQTNPRVVTGAFIAMSSRLLVTSMMPLAIGIGLDVYVVANVIIPGGAAIAIAAGLVGFFVMVWFAWPRWSGRE